LVFCSDCTENNLVGANVFKNCELGIIADTTKTKLAIDCIPVVIQKPLQGLLIRKNYIIRNRVVDVLGVQRVGV
jgi:hypothetical protein